MSAQNRYATLESDLMGKGADAPPALPPRRRTLERLTGRAALSVAPEVAAPVAPVPVAVAAEPATPTAGDAFYDKGNATAASFRPSYWTYDKSEAAPEQAAAAAEPAAIEEPPAVDLAPPPALEAEPELPPAQDAIGDEPPAIVGLPPEPTATASHQPAAADELAATIEHVLGSRYAGTRAAPASTEKPRLVASTVNANTLMAELAEARQARVGDSKASTLRQTVRAPKKVTSLLDRAFAMGGVALVLFALLALSPWRDSFLPTGISHFFH
jgi:hypothetical protein